MSKRDNLSRMVALADSLKDVNEFARQGCGQGLFVSRAEGRRAWRWMERLLQLKEAAERGQMIEFNTGKEAEFYREAYVRSHTGAIDVKAVEVEGKGKYVEDVCGE